VTTRRAPAAWCAVLGWCALAGWFAFVKNARVPLLGFVDFGFHELGHLLMYILPISQVLTAAMGSIVQIAIPAGLAAYFRYKRRDAIAACVCAVWTATNFQDVSVYIADAPHEELELVGGEHDWAFILGPENFDRLQSAQSIANVARGIGIVVLGAVIVLSFRGVLFSASARPSASDSGSATHNPGVATAPKSDDLLPSTSHMQS
jgi:hypothetical protein